MRIKEGGRERVTCSVVSEGTLVDVSILEGFERGSIGRGDGDGGRG